MIKTVTHVAKSMARLAKKCSDPGLKSFELAFTELIQIGADPYCWIFSLKKMDKKVKKMERYISVNATLYQEMEMLLDLEQTLRRMKASDVEPENLLEFQKEVMWKQHEVKNLREMSLWSRTYDYTIRLITRSIFTVFVRIKHVFGIERNVDDGDLRAASINSSQSVSTLMQSSVHRTDNTSLTRFSSGPFGTFSTKSGPISKPNKTNYFHSGPLGGSTTKSGSIARKNGNFNFHSGPLERSTAKSGQLLGMDKISKKIWQTNNRPSPAHGKKPQLRSYRLTQVGPFKGSIIDADDAIHSGILSGIKAGNLNPPEGNAVQTSSPVFRSQCRLLDAPPETLMNVCIYRNKWTTIAVCQQMNGI
ncbi:hypothetical protein ES288_A05G440700v1 [Gossypium darwinii]|uniref:DUF3475 domain-containing protein n=1 Tax=Gossypium darwinii TaxID=34276 RepID=A0A5D2GT90_GOSDA|nr:hypothetical protein ES288_A05G440700v1 [Gossypium darwinii]TYH20576.1 hypothetical protein ES288_A05G440700v1 [Gossypium darwinii]